MRLRTPTVQYLENEDGSCLLRNAGAIGGSAQAGGGGKYLLQVKRPEGVVEICGVVQSTLSRFDEHAKAEGLDLTAMSLVESGRYLDAYLQSHGHTSTVIDLYYADEHRDAHHRQIDDVSTFINLFCKLLLRLKSSFEFNNSEYPECGEGYYPDELAFRPWGNYREHIKIFTAAEAFNG